MCNIFENIVIERNPAGEYIKHKVERRRKTARGEANMEKAMKVCLVCSSGGHLTHLYLLKPFWQGKKRFWVTFDKEEYPESCAEYISCGEDPVPGTPGSDHINRSGSGGTLFLAGETDGMQDDLYRSV